MVEENVPVTRQAGTTPHGLPMSGLIAVVWRAGLRIHESARAIDSSSARSAGASPFRGAQAGGQARGASETGAGLGTEAHRSTMAPLTALRAWSQVQDLPPAARVVRCGQTPGHARHQRSRIRLGSCTSDSLERRAQPASWPSRRECLTPCRRCRKCSSVGRTSLPRSRRGKERVEPSRGICSCRPRVSTSLRRLVVQGAWSGWTKRSSSLRKWRRCVRHPGTSHSGTRASRELAQRPPRDLDTSVSLADP